jgi:hypothetical protein
MGGASQTGRQKAPRVVDMTELEKENEELRSALTEVLANVFNIYWLNHLDLGKEQKESTDKLLKRVQKLLKKE